MMICVYENYCSYAGVRRKKTTALSLKIIIIIKKPLSPYFDDGWPME